jgi:hypothetical protein
MIQSADDLRARIRDLAADEPSPARITEQILTTLTTPEFRVVATVTLHEFVRKVITQPMPVADSAQATRTYETVGGLRTPSARTAGMRDWVASKLRRHVCIDETAQVWKHLAKCTAPDLAAAAAICGRKAAQNEAKREEYEEVKKAMEHADVVEVGDLPRETLEAVLRR